MDKYICFADNFAEMIINEPEEAHGLLHLLIIVCVKVLTDWDLEANMVHLNLRLDTIPDVPQLRFCSFPSNGLFNVQGILVSRSTPSKYLISTVYECSDKRCVSNRSERVSDRQAVKKCDECGKEKIEISKARITGDHVLGMIMPIDFLNSWQTFTRCQGIIIDFKEELFSELELGIQYNVIVKKEVHIFTSWGVKPMLPESLVRALKKYIPPPFPPSIVEVFSTMREICGSSPWAHVSFFASQVSIGSYPVSSFMQLKTGLLLSLASTQGRKCPISVLALGECGFVLKNAARLCPRALVVTSAHWKAPNGLVSYEGKREWLEAGPLLLASYGVLYVGNMPKIGSTFLSQITSGYSLLRHQFLFSLSGERNHKVIKYLFAAVDSELVTLQQKPACSVIDPKILTYPLKSAVWMHWKCNQFSWQDMHQLRTLIDIFGMPYLSEIGCDDITISSSIINVACGNSDCEDNRIIDENDFRQGLTLISKTISNQFLGIISAQEVEMSEAASTLIKQYFVASRRERPDSLPIKAVKVLTAMCEAHARLSLRNIAQYEDAVAAIFLYEESVVALFGKSVMSEAPRRQCNSTTSIDVAKEMDSTLNEFSVWLEAYINALNVQDSTQSNFRSEFL
uniref:MCM AAA-lid domain-containing protein n=1 Tax=Rhodnius prolixus TaxID=13249 RepID=T1HG34_RHOPR